MDLGDFFVSEDYKLSEFKYKDVELKLYSLHSATTDFDLTGQIIWPSAIELSKFIIGNKQIFENKTVLEIGAGAGLSGFVCAKYSKLVYITDGNEKVQELIEKNVQHLKLQNVQSQLFQWGYEESKQFKDIDIIIGADVIFWQQSLMPLIKTIEQFSESNKNIQIYISGSKRSQQTEEQIDQELGKLQKQRNIIQIIKEYNQDVYLYNIQNI
ncbi:hypothetical protein pb186bvf_017560 [Paramecium bursaria]